MFSSLFPISEIYIFRWLRFGYITHYVEGHISIIKLVVTILLTGFPAIDFEIADWLLGDKWIDDNFITELGITT